MGWLLTGTAERNTPGCSCDDTFVKTVHSCTDVEPQHQTASTHINIHTDTHTLFYSSYPLSVLGMNYYKWKYKYRAVRF